MKYHHQAQEVPRLLSGLPEKEIGKIQRTVKTSPYSFHSSPCRLPWLGIDNPGEGSFPRRGQQGQWRPAPVSPTGFALSKGEMRQSTAWAKLFRTMSSAGMRATVL